MSSVKNPTRPHNKGRRNLMIKNLLSLFLAILTTIEIALSLIILFA